MRSIILEKDNVRYVQIFSYLCLRYEEKFCDSNGFQMKSYFTPHLVAA